MKVNIIPVTSFVQNCSLLICEETDKAAVVDPGGNLERIMEAVEQENVQIEKIFLTHAHLDHAGAAGELAEQLAIPVHGPHIADQFWIDAFDQQRQMFGFPEVKKFTPDRWLEDNDTVSFGNVTLDVLHCPGHTPGHVVFVHQDSKLALVGDVLFQGSIGRTDFPQGDHNTLIKSIKEKLFPLGEEIQFVPGHGPVSTFGQEMHSNPYVR